MSKNTLGTIATVFVRLMRIFMLRPIRMPFANKKGSETMQLGRDLPKNSTHYGQSLQSMWIFVAPSELRKTFPTIEW